MFHRVRSFWRACSGACVAFLAYLVARSITQEDEILAEQSRPAADTPERRATDARVKQLEARVDIRELCKDVRNLGTTVPNLGTCDNPDYATIPDRGKWRRCEWCCRAVRKDMRHRCNEKLPVGGN